MVDIPGDGSTNAGISVGGSVIGSLELVGDHDWYRLNLTAGQAVSVALNSYGTNGVQDLYLRIRDASGNVIFENDDGGGNYNSLVGFTASYSGVYYVDVGAWNEGYAGGYQLLVNPYTPPPLYSYDQIADQLVNGYWGGASRAHHFNVSPGGSLTVNLTGLTAAGQNLAREALGLWTDVIGVRFLEVSSGGQIVFDDNEEGAHASASYSGGITTSAQVNVGTEWLTRYGTNLNSYAFQTYIHEIGHALGLGHAGNYNGDADYPYSALFSNDAWSTTIMSYFDQRENTYFAGQGFTVNFVVTPMAADVLAMSLLYGLSTTTRTGDTTYGFNSNAGRAIYNASQYSNVAYTVVDSGGSDTLNYSGFGQNQRIDLNWETFSNVGGRVGNVAIARGTLIENAIGGSGSDVILGNAADNILTGGSGVDTLTGGVGSDTFRDTAAGLNGDTIVDFQSGDRILITDANAATFTFSVSGNALIFSGGTLTLGAAVQGQVVAGAASGGGVQLTLSTANIPANDVDHDFNGDGRSDVIWRHDGGAFSVWSGQANGGFVANANSNSSISTNWRVAGTGDFNGDRIDDVAWRTDSGLFSVWSGQANGGFVANANSNSSISTSWRVAGTGDFNGDGRDDVVWRSDSGAFSVWSGQSNGGFVASASSNSSIATSWQVVGTGDFNGDGRDDVVWRTDDGLFSVWSGQANGGFVANANSNSSISNSWRVVGTGDLNGDGRDDVIWRNESGAFSVWSGQANGGFVANANSNTSMPTSWHVAGTGDYNGDGREDVLWRHDAGAFSVWHGLANGGLMASPNSDSMISLAWQVQSPDTLLF